MHRLKIIIASLFLSTLGACNKSNSGPQAPIVTGISMTDFNAYPIGTIGTDNSKTYSNTIKNVVAYPNPCQSMVHIGFSSLVSDSMKIWVEAGLYKNPPTNIIIKNQSLFGKKLNAYTIYINAGKAGVSSQTDSLPDGFYRVYLATLTDTIYENILVNR